MRCTCTARSILARAVSTTCPSTPGGSATSVALRHLPHADQRVRPAPQHHPLQVPDRGQILLLRRLEDPLPQPPYVLLVHGPHDGVPVEGLVLRSVHRLGVQLALRFRWFQHVLLQRLTHHTSARFRGRAPGPVSGQLYGCPPAGDTGDRWLRFPVSFRLPAFASWVSCSRHGIPPPLAVGLPPRLRGRDGPDRVSTFRTLEIRPGRVPPVPREQRCPRDRRTVLGRRLPILSGSLLIIPASATRRGELP